MNIHTLSHTHINTWWRGQISKQIHPHITENRASMHLDGETDSIMARNMFANGKECVRVCVTLS